MHIRAIAATLALLCLSAPAQAGRTEAEEAARSVANKGPAASAAEIPALALLLSKAGWEPTPELSGVFVAGGIFEPTAIGHRMLAANCFSMKPLESTYTAAELVTSLQAGVAVGVGVAKGSASAGIVKKVKFGTPVQVTIPRIDLEMSQSCAGKLKKLPAAQLSSAYVVQEVLKAEISEQTCGKVDAGGRFVGLGEADADFAAACAQASLEPVAVGYRTVPLVQLLSVPVETQTVVQPVVRPPVGEGVVGGGFDASGALAQIRAAEELKARLESELAGCLTSEKEKLLAQATTDANALAPLLKETSAKAKELGGPQVKRYVEVYGAATVRCRNDLGERSRSVSVPQVATMRAWLDAPASGGGVTGGAWVGASGYWMRAVPAGTYEVGCTAGQSGCDRDEEPAHSVKLTHRFLMGETEITQGLWQSVMGSNPSRFSSCGPTCPVEQVSWVDAATFANRLSDKDGLDACYTISGGNVVWTSGWTCNGYRLPTEAEWEVAARGGGDDLYSGSVELSTVGWYDGNSGGSTHPVGKMKANGYGLYDMSGNVWEWVWDWYADYRGGMSVDPQGAASGVVRLIRGGSWGYSPPDSRVASRLVFVPGYRSLNLGFRLSRSYYP